MKNKTKYLGIYLGLILLTTGCGFANFTAMPGSPRTAFPTELQGKYIATNKGVRTDTFFLTITENKSITNDPILSDLIQLTDSTRLSHLGDFYFFNVRSSDSAHKNDWTIFPVYQKNDFLYIYSMPLGKQTHKLEKYLKQNSNGDYIMDNEPFKTYCEKYLKKKKYRKKASKLKKIK